MLNPVHYGTTQSAGYPGSSTSVLASRLSNAPMYFPATQVVEVSDSASSPVNPQKSVIEDAVSQFCNTSREQDRIVILFAGHAVEIDKEAYLVPYEGHKDDAKTLIPLAWVYDQLAKCKARQKIFVLDAFRFPPARGFELPGTGAMSEDFEAKFHNPPPGVQAWSACVKDQQSIEFDGGSLFLQCVSHALQERLGGLRRVRGGDPRGNAGRQSQSAHEGPVVEDEAGAGDAAQRQGTGGRGRLRRRPSRCRRSSRSEPP